MEIGLPYGKFLEKKYGFAKVKRVPYSGGIANFLALKDTAAAETNVARDRQIEHARPAAVEI